MRVPSIHLLSAVDEVNDLEIKVGDQGERSFSEVPQFWRLSMIILPFNRCRCGS